MYFLLPLALIANTTVANSDWLMSCEDYRWFLEGLEKSEALSDLHKEEVKQRMKEATRPECFWG